MINSIKEIFKQLANKANQKGFYADFNYMNITETRITLDQTNTEINKDNDLGIKIRIWDGEKFLESGTTSIKEYEVKTLFESLLDQAEHNQDQIKTKIDLDIDKTKLTKDFGHEEIQDIELKQRVEYLKKIKKNIESIDDDILNARVALIKKFEHHIFVNKYKNLTQQIPCNLFVGVAVAKTDFGPKMVFDSFTSVDFECIENFKNKIEKFKEKIKIVKKAKPLPKGGKYQVILAPHVTGLLAHESFGHGMEADTMLKGRALANEWIGKKIANKEVSIVDYPLIEGKHGYFYFDHEGNLANKVYLVKEGIVNEPLADVYSKTKMNLKYAGSSRFESFDHKNYVRMSNTYFEGGSENFEDMIKKVNDGIFIFETGGGMEDPKTWGVQVQNCAGQRIVDGKLVDEYYDGFSISGFLPDIMKNISGVSKDCKIEGGGWCGKGHKEWVRVSDGGSYLLIDEILLG